MLYLYNLLSRFQIIKILSEDIIVVSYTLARLINIRVHHLSDSFSMSQSCLSYVSESNA
jgi:hypothetical protein